ncbi:MAG: neuromedin U [Casimicrobiaceae bacterium]
MKRTGTRTNDVGDRCRRWLPAAITVASMGFHAAANAEMSAEELAKLAQNPVGNLISVPFQNNTNFNYGPEKGTQNILNIQPVIPISISEDWNIITRTIVPLIWQPALGPDDNRVSGLGDLQFTAFLSPAKPGEWIWGVGPIIQAPTHSNSKLGNSNWGLGPSFVVLHLDKGSPWVYGVLVNNIWSTSSNKQGGSYSNGLIQPFVNYNFEGGLYLTTAPIATVNWKADGSQQWTVPIGGGVGKIFHLGKLPVNTQISGYYNVVKPDFGANWQVRAQVQLMFPK